MRYRRCGGSGGGAACLGPGPDVAAGEGAGSFHFTLHGSACIAGEAGGEAGDEGCGHRKVTCYADTFSGACGCLPARLYHNTGHFASWHCYAGQNLFPEEEGGRKCETG